MTKRASQPSSSRVELKHLDKVFWPQLGLTKGDVVNYYTTLAPTILPYLKDRPHSLLRQPDGLKGPKFFQKDIVEGRPQWLKTTTVYSPSAEKDVHYLVCDSVDALLYMVELGCIEIDPWNSRAPHLHKPDWLVIDLDPEGVSFAEVVTVARAVHMVCEQVKLPSYPKTSGQTGIHVYIPLGAKYSFDEVSGLAKRLAQAVHAQEPKITSLERHPAKRRHKVYIDYLQNRLGQTLAAPYSLRPTPHATVSTPLHWEEVNGRLSPERFTIKTMQSRLKKVGDLWQPVLGKRIDVPAILHRLPAAEQSA